MPAAAMHSVRSRKGSEANADLQFKSITRKELAKLIADGSDGKVNLSQAGVMLKNTVRLGQMHPSLRRYGCSHHCRSDCPISLSVSIMSRLCLSR